ncbi:MAG TPA: ferritin-like domain-containing protein [Candidatus Thermoplasmatota archaeon]|nr:ferritin-like domain-containing protein [Candidatus Thermoplasmatota archaeon]
MARTDVDKPNQKVEKALASLPVGTEDFLEILLNHALEAEGNFLSLYDVCIRKVGDKEIKGKLEEFRGDHEGHVREIRGLLDQVGAATFVAELQPTPLARSIARTLEEAPTDAALLTAFLATEDFSRRFYQWAAVVGGPEPLVRVAERALRDEERHYRWTAKHLGIGDEA